LGGCDGGVDYVTLWTDKGAKKIGALSISITKKKWTKTGSDVAVTISMPPLSKVKRKMVYRSYRITKLATSSKATALPARSSSRSKQASYS